MPKDYYIVLGVNRGANLNKIKKAYRTVIKKYHPDITQTKESTARFLEVKEAYETLSDEEKRKRYDEEIAERGSALRISKVPEIIERRRTPFDRMERLYSALTDDFFEGFMPGFLDLHRDRVQAKDLYFEAILSPREAAEGGLFPVSVPLMEPCPRCYKTGIWEDFFCPVCAGYGRVKTEKSFSLSIPPNVRHGAEIRLSMEDIGLQDVYLNIMVFIDPELEREEW